MSKLQYTKPSIKKVGPVVVKTEGSIRGDDYEVFSVRWSYDIH